MSLADIIRSGIATANQMTSSLQCNVSHQAWISQDGFGAATLAASVNRAALVEYKTHMRQTFSGQTVLVEAKVTFIHPVPPNGAAGRHEPIDPRDVLTLPDGRTGKIVDTSGLSDPSTGKPYMLEVWIGALS